MDLPCFLFVNERLNLAEINLYSAVRPPQENLRGPAISAFDHKKLLFML